MQSDALHSLLSTQLECVHEMTEIPTQKNSQGLPKHLLPSGGGGPDVSEASFRHPGRVTEHSDASNSPMSATYKRYALVLMTTIYGLNLIERPLLGLLIEPIRIDLDLSDTQIGLLTGVVFGLFYTLAGVPLSRWSDRGNRSLIAASCIGLWGVTMMGFILVGNFVQLLIARMTVAIGEAGCKPPTYSLIGDYFPGALERTRAMSIFWLSNPLAALTGFIIGGWLSEHLGWRMTFFVMGIPGLMIAVLAWFTLKEPRREAITMKTAVPRPAPPLRAAFLAIWQEPTARHMMFALILFYMLGHGMQSWYAAFLMRSHGLGTGEVGLWMGIVQGGGGIVGVLSGGFVANRWFAGNERNQLRVAGITIASMLPLLGAFLFMSNKYLALAALVPYMVMLYFFFAPTFAVFQRLMPNNMRATTLAIVMTAVHLISMGIGPQVIGALSDVLKPEFGSDSLRYSMLIVATTAVFAGYQFWKAARTVVLDLAKIERTADVALEH